MKTSVTAMSVLLDNRFRVFQHIAFTGLIFFFWFLFRIHKIQEQGEILKLSLYSATYTIVAYVNMYFLFGRFLLRGRIAVYALLSVATFVSSYVTQSFIYFEGWEKWRSDFTFGLALAADMLINAITYYMFIGIGLSVRLIKAGIRNEHRIMRLEQENLKANLANLKSQMSPHFLFNTFNNLYVLTKTNPRIAGEMMLGFADLMRYQLTESQNEKVKIENEVGYIENLLGLEKLRKNHLDVRLYYEKSELAGILVEPLLFVSLVENAIKHGSQQMEQAYIHVDIRRSNGSCTFEVVNSKPVVSRIRNDHSLGKGLENLRRRLQLSYPEKHRLDLVDDPGRFSARLKIELA